MRHLDLFAGIGGFSLAASWMGWETVAQVEWDKWCQKVLAKNFPDSLRFGDIVEFNKMLKNGEIITDTEGAGKYRINGNNNGTEKENGVRSDKLNGNSQNGINLGRIDIITGGFPCQPFSHAGKRKGVADERYLWPEMLRTIRILKPSFVVGENVAGLVSMDNGKTLDGILADLENEGYQVESFIIPACAVGAWHRRDRIWIVAHTLDSADRTIRGQGRETEGIQKLDRQTGLSGEFSGTSGEVRYNVTDCNNQGLQGGTETGNIRSIGTERNKQPERHGELFRGNYWQSEPSVGGGFNGLPLWLHRFNIKGYGQEESYRRIEILRELWKTIPTQILWQVIGGFNQVQKSEILFAIVCEYEARPNETRVLLESQKTLEEFVRGLWLQGEITGSSYRSDKGEQPTGEYTDSMQTLSRLLAHDLQENWQVSSWEDGVPRVSTGVKNRVDRLKGLGNAIVPQVAFQIFQAIENET